MSSPLSSTPDTARTWPPAPHDPRERVPLQQIGPWQVRIFARNDPRHAYFASRGMLHLQLWAPESGLSVLTPSRLTDNMMELLRPGERIRFRCYWPLVELLHEEHQLSMLHPRALEHFLRWHVYAPALCAVGRPGNG